MYGWVRVSESQIWQSLCTQGRMVWIFCETSLPFCSSGRNLCGYTIFQTSKQILMVLSPSTCYLHIALWHASFKHATHIIYMALLLGEHLHPVYFRNQVHILLFFVFSVRLSSRMLPMQFTWHVQRGLHVIIQYYFQVDCDTECLY